MKSLVKIKEILICENCGEEVYQCDDCGKYFKDRDGLWCQLEVIKDCRNRHFCKVCSEEDWDES
jgi:hypothetical protein